MTVLAHHLENSVTKIGRPVVVFAATVALTLFLYYWITTAATSIATTPWILMWVGLGLFVWVVLVAATTAIPLASTTRDYIRLGLLSIFLTGMVALVLKNTPFALDGVQGDQRLYASYITKFATYGGYGDVVYKGLPAFYPPLYFWWWGQVAAWSHIESYQVLKIALLVVTFLQAYLIYHLWKPSVGAGAAVAVAYGLLFFQEWYKTAEWLSLIVFVPWWLYWVTNSTNVTPSTWRDRLLWFGVGGVIGSLVFQTYYYWFFIGAVSLVLHTLWDGMMRGTTDKSQSPAFGNAVTMLGSTAFFSSIFWGPYLWSMAQTGGWSPLQNRWLSDSKIEIPLPFVDASPIGVVFAIGLLYIVLTSHRSRISLGLMMLVAGIYGWIGIGYVGMLTDRPLLTFRVINLLEYVLAAGAALACYAFARYALTQTRKVELFSTLAWHRLIPVAVLVGILFWGQRLSDNFMKDSNVQSAITTQVPNALLDSFDTVTGNQYRDKVFLLGYGYRDLMAYRPLYAFIPWSAHFSHPAALYRDRVNFLAELAATNDPRLFAAALMNNRYSKIDYLLLEREDTSWKVNFLDDNFPNSTIERSFALDEELLVAPYFTQSTVGDLTLFAPDYTQNPLGDIDINNLPGESLETLVLLYDLAGTFGDHIDLPDHEQTRDEVQQILLASDLATLPVESLLNLQRAATGALHDHASEVLEAKLPNTLNIVLQDADGTPKVRVIGYAIQPQAPEDSDTELALYFEALDPIKEDYTLWVHADREGEQLNFDHALNAPTTTWRVGKIYRDTYVLNAEQGDYHFILGFWLSESGVRLTQPTGDNSIDLGVLTLPQ